MGVSGLRDLVRPHVPLGSCPRVLHQRLPPARVPAASSGGRGGRSRPCRRTRTGPRPHTRPPARPPLRRRSRGRPPRLHGPPGHRLRGVRTLHAGSPIDGLAHGFHRRRPVVLPNVRRRAARRADPRVDHARAGTAVRRGPPQRPLNMRPAQRAYSARMASNKQHLETLRSVALFSACSNKELEKVAPRPTRSR